jgi:hypothetical protein
LPQGVAHQAARRVLLVCVKNRLMLRELAMSVLPALARKIIHGSNPLGCLNPYYHESIAIFYSITYY